MSISPSTLSLMPAYKEISSVDKICTGMYAIKAMHMYRKYGQIFTPAISALPPSVVGVLG